MEPKKIYYPAVDGLRVFALISVLFYHLIPSWAPGGYYGVLVFFVLSGYFSTTRFLKEWQNSQKIKLTHFYKKRFRRLFPSILWFLILSSALLVYFDSKYLVDFRGVFFSSIAQVNNWWQIFAGKSYFEQMGAPSPFNHLWYMSILGQLYLLYPLFFGITISYLDTGKKMIQLLTGIIFSSAILMSLLYFFNDNLNRIYYGTDTRLFSFFVGALLAVIQYNLNKNKKTLTLKSQYFLFFISFSIMLFFIINFYDYQIFNYLGGMLLFSFLAALALWSVLDHRNLLNRLCSNPLIAYLSKRSFQIYLWQYPIILVYDEFVSIQVKNYWIHLIIKLSIILFFSEFSYRLIEQRKVHWFHTSRTQSKYQIKKCLLWIGMAFILSSSVFALVTAPKSTAFEQKLQEELLDNQEAVEENEIKNTKHHPFEDELRLKGYTDSDIQKANEIEPIAVGDSILLNIAPELNKIFPNAIIDAEIGRQLYNSYDIFARLHSQYPDSQPIIILLGSNGNFKKEDLQEILSLFSTQIEIFIVNTTVPKSWQANVNNTLSKVSADNPNVTLIDWANESIAYRAEWFYEDGTHMNEQGRKALTQLISKAILRNE